MGPKFLTFEESVFVFSGLSDLESVTQRILFLDSLFLLSFYQFFQLSLVTLCPCMHDVRDLILYTICLFAFCLLLVFLTLILSFAFDYFDEFDQSLCGLETNQ